ncbi:phosphoribosyl-ATP pyrophosphohydrolase [Erwinia phage Rouille]|jgi:hypothetical protein|uniref:Gp070 n=1 Tax=Erwinia phage vB_Eam-MM7 TaxID=1051674 RepID=G0YPQ2_9CAUD|nr:MazG-like pyrophosphatase [Erwinia phage vB_Eam-MM7]AEJ81329.1 gp070 [Erwinia phage vB_Eam-MM7]UNA01044.1 hypothetical protein 1Hena2_00094 [Erwinia phage Hena2]WJN64836.1 phosphoribosyl-ATP pyrophosphohydrolase [Erwinia phage Rouille]WLW39303.1 MazG-like pyrophosphatase [Erwinia phage vB_EamM-BoyaciRG1]
MYVTTNNPVHLWNIRAGLNAAKRYSPEYWKALENQAERMMEELKETIQAIRERDALGLIDGQVDMDFVLQGFTYLSQLDHETGLKRVCDNNDLKITEDAGTALRWLDEHNEKDPQTACEVVGTEVNGKVYYTVHRLSDNKIMKPVNHPTVTLYDLVAGNTEIFVPSKESCTLCKSLAKTLESLGYSFTVLDLDNSEADIEFAEEVGLDIGCVAFFDGESVVRLSVGAGHDKEFVSNWLKGVGANGKAD